MSAELILNPMTGVIYYTLWSALILIVEKALYKNQLLSSLLFALILCKFKQKVDYNI